MINHIKRNVIPYAFGFVFFAMLVNFIVLYNKEDMGQYGDIFGASNALFTGLALAFLIYGIFLQREEINIAKEDLRRTKDILDEQSKYINYQKFNDQFFSMIGLLSDYIINYKYIYNREFHGNMALRNKKNSIFRNVKGGSKIKIVNMEKDDISIAIKNLDKNNTSINNELNDIHQIIKITVEIALFLNRSKIEEEYYINILRSVINDDLANILCVYIYINKKYDLEQILINKYKIAYWP